MRAAGQEVNVAFFRQMNPIVPHLARLLALSALLMASAGSAAGDEAWSLERFHSDIAIEVDGSILVVETIEANFGGLQRHGIFRDIRVRQPLDDDTERVYRFFLDFVIDGKGEAVPYKRSSDGPFERLTIGRDDRTVSGRQTYRLGYRIRDVVNRLADRDELTWDVSGSWPVPTRSATAAVLFPVGGLAGGRCVQGSPAATEGCEYSATGDRIDYEATRTLASGERLLIRADVRKGLLPEPRLVLESKKRESAEQFSINPLTAPPALLIGAAGFVFLGRRWWLVARDRWYLRVYYADRPRVARVHRAFGNDPVGVEFEPPSGLRPAEIGVLLDERPDGKDLVATIVQLAVRGYVGIAEIPMEGSSGEVDWALARLRPDATGLRRYEELLLDAMFTEGNETRLSRLKGRFFETLPLAERSLREQVLGDGLFLADPAALRRRWLGIGGIVFLVGWILTLAFGQFLGWGVAVAPLALVGLALLVSHRFMPVRSPEGSESLWHALAFRRYLDTAEKESPSEPRSLELFGRYLPYAIVYGSAERWARAFRDADISSAVHSWYVGPGERSATEIARSLHGFFAALSSAVARRTTGRGTRPFTAQPGGSGSW